MASSIKKLWNISPKSASAIQEEKVKSREAAFEEGR
jgi:hypothetical protein